jgi:anti-anti-sigma factor
MPLSIQLSERQRPDGAPATVIKLVGDLDSITSPQAKKELTPALTGGAKFVELDLAGLTSISSAGLGLLIYVSKTLAARGAQSFITNPQPQIQKVFEIVQASKGMSLFSSTKELDEYLTAIQRKMTGGG